MKAIKLLVMITMILISMIIFNCAATMNFSGDWSMNEEKTDMEGGTQMLPTKLTILHKGNNLSIERFYEREWEDDFSFKEVLTLDGEECESSIFNFPTPEIYRMKPEDTRRKSVASWSNEDKMLTISSNTIFNSEGTTFEINTKEKWDIIEEWNVLSVTFTADSPSGERNGTIVYEKGKGDE